MDLHPTGASSAMQFHIRPLEEAVCNFCPSSLLPQLYIWSVLWALHMGLQFSFWKLRQGQPWNSETPMGFHQAPVNLFLEQTVDSKWAHHLCNIDITIFSEIICMLLTFAWFSCNLYHDHVMYGIIIPLQCISSVVV